MERIAVEDVWQMQDERGRINRARLDEIIWTLDGKELTIKPEIIEHFESTGLNNCDFITTNYWRQGVDPEVLREAGLDDGAGEEDRE